jgi:hypothetical protein
MYFSASYIPTHTSKDSSWKSTACMKSSYKVLQNNLLNLTCTTKITWFMPPPPPPTNVLSCTTGVRLFKGGLALTLG